MFILITMCSKCALTPYKYNQIIHRKLSNISVSRIRSRRWLKPRGERSLNTVVRYGVSLSLSLSLSRLLSLSLLNPSPSRPSTHPPNPRRFSSVVVRPSMQLNRTVRATSRVSSTPPCFRRVLRLSIYRFSAYRFIDFSELFIDGYTVWFKWFYLESK